MYISCETITAIFVCISIVLFFVWVEWIKKKILSNNMYTYYKYSSDGNFERQPLKFIFNGKEIALMVVDKSFQSDVHTCWNRINRTLTINDIPAFTIYEIQHTFHTTRTIDYNEYYDRKQLKQILKAANKAYEVESLERYKENNIKKFV